MNRQLAWSLGIAFLFEMAFFMVVPLIPLHFTALGASPAQLGAYMAWAAVIPAALLLYLGRMADRFGHVRAMAGGALIFGASVAGLVIFDQPWTAALCIGLFYLGDSTVVIANQVYVGSLGGPGEQVRYYGWFGAAINVGAMVGPVVGGAIADWRGPSIGFAAAAAISLGALALFPFLPPIQRAAANPAPMASGAGIWRTSWRLLAVQALQYSLLAMVLLQLGGVARNSFYPLYLAEEGLSSTLVGALFSVYSLAGVLIRTVTGYLSDRIGIHRFLLGSLGICCAALALTPFTANFWLLALLAACLGAGHASVQPLTNAAVAVHVPPSDRGLAFALRMAVQQAFAIVVPLLLGWTAGGFGLGAPMLAAAAGILTGMALLHLLFRGVMLDRPGA